MNKFTEKSVLILSDLFTKIGGLNNIYLNQNRIQFNKVSKIKKDLKKIGINLYT